MDFVSQAYSQLVELIRSMSAGTRVATGLLLALVVVSLVYLFQYQVNGGDELLLAGRTFSQKELTAIEAAFAKAGLGKVKLEIVKAEYGAGSTQRDVTGVLQKYAGDLQLISLPAATYNEAFGGDPAAGAVKQLKIQYRINGKPSEATFAENALIILPMPK